MRVDMARYLFVVSKARPELRDYLVDHFSDEQDVLVTLDRRQGERRQVHAESGRERRQAHRRWRPENDEALESIGAFMVPLEEGEAVA
jgi:hypothetical protein